ncbi:LysR family transcriptional regulator [Virgisporangium aliadipatigenens]|uniref:LysR family transcriptional regulator n=1 Tax=Virgisporangium aliadipatigenens TaxID=741659 RepID=A0A8J4DQJ1_9ACTN|nr:LysR family transcriptional regulator [Virgisporangium aliadipatigenens]GIJ46046.1 LysR family transcriptional regulator [Virgisporangium aliadipatigenens]
MDVEVRHLRALVAVVDAGTFTDAAAALGVSQAAVSRAVAALESTLGARVLERSTRHVALTGTGTRVLTHARRVLDELAHLRRTVEDARGELRVGYAFAALGKHTRRLQKRWAAAHPGTPLVFTHANTETAGLSEGTADVAVLRKPLRDRRFAVAAVGTEARYAAVATDSAVARRRSLKIAELARYPIAIDERGGSTTPGLWEGPIRTRATHSVDEWLTLIAAGQAVGVTAEATANQNPRPGVAYRVLRDAPRIEVSLAWWRDDPPPHLDELIGVVRELYAARR